MAEDKTKKGEVKVAGELRGVTVKTKIDEQEKEVYFLELKVKMYEGQDDVQSIIKQLGKTVRVDIRSAQLTIPSTV